MLKPAKIFLLIFLVMPAVSAFTRLTFAQAQPTPIECGKTVTGSIDIAGEKDAYSFNASKGDLISIFIFRISGNPLVYLELYDPNGVNIAGGLARIDKKVTLDGAYSIIVKDKDDKRTGEYSLIWQRMNNPCANSLSYGQPAQGSISQNERIKFYSFSASANDFIVLRAATVSGNMDAYLELYAPDGISLAKSAARIDKKLLIDGIYTVIIRDEYDDETGDYVLNCEKINDSPDAVDIPFGETITGRFDSFNETDIYKFTADVNDKIYIVFYPITVRFNSSVPLLELYDSTGAKLPVYNSRGRILHVDIPRAGTTYLLITNNSTVAIGDYEFTIQRKNNPAHSRELKYDSIMNDSINSPAQIDAYQLTANANDTISLCSESEDFSPYFELYDADGLPVYENFEQPQHIFRFSESGLFYLFITDTYALKGGAYNFILLKGDIACSGIDLVGPKVLVKTPNKGEIIESGSEFTIWWDSSDNAGIVSQEVALSTDSGRTYAAIASGLERNNAYVWRVPANLNTTQARIKVVARDAQGNIGEDQSDADFSILNTALPPGAKDAGYEYDRLNRLIVSSVNTVKSAEYSYDASGNRLILTAYENQQQPKPPVNLIFNPDMEQGVISPTGWYTVGATGANIRAIWAADYAYSPIHSLKITNTSALAVSLGTLMGWQGRPVNFSAPYPRTLNLSGWARASGLRLFTDGYAALKLNIIFSDNTAQVYYLRFLSGSYNWRKAQVRQTFNKTIKSIRPQLVLYKAQGTVWFDDISIAP